VAANVRLLNADASANASPSGTHSTGTVAPAGGSALYLLARARRDNHTTAWSWAVSGGSLSWSQVYDSGEIDEGGFGSAFAGRYTVWRAVAGGSPGSFAVTSDPTGAGSANYYHNLTLWEVIGDDTGFVEAAEAHGSTSPFAPTLSGTPAGPVLGMAAIDAGSVGTWSALTDGAAYTGEESGNNHVVGIVHQDGAGTSVSVPVSATSLVAMALIVEIDEDATDRVRQIHGAGLPVTYPTTATGDLLVLVYVNDGGDNQTTPTGWTRLDTDAGTSVEGGAYYRIVGGTPPTGTFTLGVSGEEATWVIWHFPASLWHGTTPPEMTRATAATGTPDCPSLTPSGWDASAEDTYWLAAVARDDDDNMASVASSGYDATYAYSTSSITANGVEIGAGWRVAATATENPGAASVTGTGEEWFAWTIAVRPASTGGQTATAGGASGATAAGSATLTATGQATATAGGATSATSAGGATLTGGSVTVTAGGATGAGDAGPATLTPAGQATATAGGASGSSTAGSATVTATGQATATAGGASSATSAGPADLSSGALTTAGGATGTSNAGPATLTAAGQVTVTAGGATSTTGAGPATATATSAATVDVDHHAWPAPPRHRIVAGDPRHRAWQAPARHTATGGHP